jgi:hypothetical protein
MSSVVVKVVVVSTVGAIVAVSSPVTVGATVPVGAPVKVGAVVPVIPSVSVGATVPVMPSVAVITLVAVGVGRGAGSVGMGERQPLSAAINANTAMTAIRVERLAVFIIADWLLRIGRWINDNQDST